MITVCRVVMCVRISCACVLFVSLLNVLFVSRDAELQKISNLCNLFKNLPDQVIELIPLRYACVK